jgi:hypothetical protein
LASRGRESRRSGKSNSTPIAGECWPSIGLPFNDSPTFETLERTIFRPSMSSVADFHAKTSATLASERELTENAADSGASLPESLANYDRATSSWRTSQLCLDGEWAEFSETWPRSGMTRNGKTYELPTLVHHTGESESGLWPTPRAIYGEHPGMTHPSHLTGEIHFWPTPQAHDAICGRGKNNLFADAHYYPHDLADAVMWPTPRAEDSQCIGNHPGAVDSLHAAVKLWPTPEAADGTRGSLAHMRGNPTLLGAARNWPTPTADDANNATRASGAFQSLTRELCATPMPSDVDGGRTTKGKDRQDETGLRGQVGGQLNPTWVEWLMGYPLGWTDCGDSATRSSRKSLNGSGGKS